MENCTDQISDDIENSFNDTIILLSSSLENLNSQIIQTDKLLEIDFEKANDELQTKQNKLSSLQLELEELEKLYEIKLSNEEKYFDEKNSENNQDRSISNTEAIINNEYEIEDLKEILGLYLKITKIK